MRQKRLEEQVRELDRVAKMLVRRDFELFQTNELLREMDEAKSQFDSLAAHQLRTPLSAIKWSLQMLAAGDFGEINKEQLKVAEKTLATLEHMIALVSDLLNVARIESGQFVYQFVPFSLEELVKSTAEELRSLGKDSRVSLELSLSEKPLPLVYGDRENIQIVLQNLLENAIMYNHPQGSVTITVETHPSSEKRARVMVQDTGIGIPEDQIRLVGQKFFRADNAARSEVQGTGLGLYTAMRILERHSSKVEIQSEKGKGSTFSFSLPFAQSIP